MVTTHSAGIIIFREETGKPRKYLLLLKKNRAEFPKGKIERGESKRQAALRETLEEAGIGNVQILKGFREKNEFAFSLEGEKIDRVVTYFLGKTTQRRIRLSKEHVGYRWLSADQAVKKLKYPAQRELVKKAEEFLTK